MMCKRYMLIAFTNGTGTRHMTDRYPIDAVKDIYNKEPDIISVEVYKYIKERRDYKYICTISIERGLCDD